MQNSVFMRVMHGARYLCDEFHRLPHRNRRALDDVVELPAFDELHAEVARAITLAHFVDRDNARMIETGGSFGFPAETLQMRFARPLTKANDFERDCAVETFLPGPKYHALTATTDLFQQFVVAQFSQHFGEARCSRYR